MSVEAKSWAVVANPVGAKEASDRLAVLLRERDLDVTWLETTPDDPGRGQADRAVENGADLIVACGGDGTVRACVEAMAQSDAALAIIPAGTGNLLARNLGIPVEVDAAFDVIETGVRCSIDVGYANGEAFAVMAGVGLDARMVRDTDRTAKQRFGSLAYVGTALRHLTDSPFDCQLSVDGQLRWRGPASSVLVANHGSVQGGIDLFPDASAHDGRLDVMATAASGIGAWLRAAWAVLSHDPSAGPIERFTGISIVVRTDQPVPYELDGEERPPTREVAYDVVPGAVSVVVPKERLEQ